MPQEHKSAMPAVGETAPDFRAGSTMGPRTLADYRGRWLMLFSHPGDFTPVCTTEFLAFEQALPAFASRGCDLLALSVDSNATHLAWLYSLYQRTGVEIHFPVLDDSGGDISADYGMRNSAQKGSRTQRCVFFICPLQKIRCVLCYPESTGRSSTELLRILDALQLHDREGLSTPADWQPGVAALAKAPQSRDALVSRLSDPVGLCCMDWYLCLSDTKQHSQ